MISFQFLRTAYTDSVDTQPSPLLPLAGLVTGLVGLGAYWLGTVLFPPPYLPVLLSMAAVAALTQTRPERGVALFAGRRTTGPAIDSYAPTNGLVWLVLLLATRLFAVQALFANEPFGLIVALKYVMAHSLSHLMALSVRWSVPRRRSDSDTRPLANPSPSVGARGLAIALGLLPMLVLIMQTTLWIYGLFLIPLLLLRWWLTSRFRRETGGDTGVWSGTVQQVSELLVYLSFVSLLWISV